jgi:hypothetical protein
MARASMSQPKGRHALSARLTAIAVDLCALTTGLIEWRDLGRVSL